MVVTDEGSHEAHVLVGTNAVFVPQGEREELSVSMVVANKEGYTGHNVTGLHGVQSLLGEAKLGAGDPAGDPSFDLSKVAEPFSEALPMQRSYVMPEDVARCFRLAIEADDPPPLDIFIVAAGDTIGQVNSLAHMERELGHLAEVRKPDLYANDPTASLLDSSHARDVLGWQTAGTWADVVAKYGALLD